MSGIVLSAAVRQNLLSLQSTAALLATTQNNLATGNRVNSALDDPSSYFTAQALTNRAGDISNLLDGIGNGVQVLQAANTGITSLQNLISNAQSVGNEVLQTAVGYLTKSSVTTSAITGNNISADNLLGSGTTASNAVTGTAKTATTPVVTATTGTKLSALGITSDQLIGFTTGFINFSSTTGTHVIGATQNTSLDLSTATVQDFLNAANLADQNHVTWSFSAGQITATPIGGHTGQINNGGSSGTAITALGLTATNAYTTPDTGSVISTGGVGAITASSTLTTLASAVTTSDTLTVNGKTISFVNTGAGNSISANGGTIDLASATISDVLSAIDTIDGSSTASTVGTAGAGKITLNTGTANDLTVSGSVLAKLGLGAGTTDRIGLTLNIASTGNGTATAITFGTGSGQVSTLNQLNTQLSANNLQATISTTGAIAIETTNNAASSTIQAISGTAAQSGGAFYSTATSAALVAAAPVADPNSQATRLSLVNQYNQVLQQINATQQDSSFNGINLLSGDTLNLTFDETGASKLSITGVGFNDAGLGLSTLTGGTDFLDSNSANAVLAKLTQASTTLRTEASSLGSNLSVVEVRQDFNKNLINVLQTGASNLTLADPNQEAANSQALSTRQSIAVSALALANQSQQSVLQLLR